MKHDDVLINIEAMLDGAETPETEECCIYRVPFRIRRHNEDAYTPMVVSIGPFHHNGHRRLHNMERHKLIYCKAFLKRNQTTSDSWIHYIEGVEPYFRRCYSHTLEFSKEELVKIIFVDSGFIFELFLRYYFEELSGDNMFLIKPWLRNNLVVDLVLLENQLPFFVLEGLFNLSFSCSTSGSNVPSFLELTFFYFKHFNKSNLDFDNINVRHFTDLIRAFHLQYPLERRPSMTRELVKHLPSVTELLETGVKFKVLESDCLLDLGFSGRVLEIPQLDVDDSTELLFRNMMALEQCHYPYESYITDYATVLDFLINTSRDVDILVQKGVLVNWLGETDSVANLFNGICKNITQVKFNSHYSDVCQRLNAFCNNPYHKLRSTLRHDYCKSPWQTAASIAGIVLLILSLFQTVCSVLQVTQQ